MAAKIHKLIVITKFLTKKINAISDFTRRRGKLRLDLTSPSPVT